MPINGGRAERYQAILRAEAEFYLKNGATVDEENLDMENVYVQLAVDELDLKQNNGILREDKLEDCISSGVKSTDLMVWKKQLYFLVLTTVSSSISISFCSGSMLSKVVRIGLPD